ncbi:MAG: nitrate/nitrite transporter NrtS [Bacteroidetes bacterium]|nr:nitrate/nitrite transporter NrtS [Bacteroidota bacterium]
MRKENYITALKISLIVGTILNLINSFDSIFCTAWTWSLIFKLTLTYCVPFCVSLYSSWKAIK